jgi:hypothetical protein
MIEIRSVLLLALRIYLSSEEAAVQKNDMQYHCVQYRSTGRGFVVEHIPFAENYRLYSRSHFVKA